MDQKRFYTENGEGQKDEGPPSYRDIERQAVVDIPGHSEDRGTLLTPQDALRNHGEKGSGVGVQMGSDMDIAIEFPRGAIFRQMNVLVTYRDGHVAWKEMARWLKYEEKLEQCGRWSRPHISTCSLRALLEILRDLEANKTTIIFETEGHQASLQQVAWTIMEKVQKHRHLSSEKTNLVLERLLKPHKLVHRKRLKHTKSAARISHTGSNVSSGGAMLPVAMKRQGGNASQERTRPPSLRRQGSVSHKPNKKLMKKIPDGSEAANILVGQCDGLDEPITVLLRMRNAVVYPEMTEVLVPTRFMYILMCPAWQKTRAEIEEVGRAAAALFGEKVFLERAYTATSRHDMVTATNDALDDMTVLPPSMWDQWQRLEPPEYTPMPEAHRQHHESSPTPVEDHSAPPVDVGNMMMGLHRTGRLFGGLVEDMKRRYRQYGSDIKDGLSLQCLASIVFLYFACVTPIVTFGGLLGHATDGNMGTMECMFAGAICGLIFALCGGQPLIIVGATGPMLVFETILYGFCKDYGIDFLSFRFWTGTWVTITLLLIVMFDLSALVRYITRFTEESFAVLISLIFIVEAFMKVGQIFDVHPMHLTGGRPDLQCHCELPEDLGNNTASSSPTVTANAVNQSGGMLPETNWTASLSEDCITHRQRVIVSHDCIDEQSCLSHGWVLQGESCYLHTFTRSVPDVFLFSLFLFFLTFGIAVALRSFRSTPYFPSFVRSTVADFAVFISILICACIDLALRLETPKLMVPSSFKTTLDGRGWVVNPMGVLPGWYMILLAVLPSLLATILVFLDQQITAVIANRDEHKLKKGPGYHLDLFVLAVLIFICSLLGLPWFVAATVRTVTHVQSLKKVSEVQAPGEKPEMQGVREQRVTAFFIHLLIGISVLLTSVLKHVPMAVLYGVFLFMGVTSLQDVQFVDRILLMFMPGKHQPDHIYLRHVAINRVHLFTFIQLLCMGGMWAVKSVKIISIAFPIMVLLLCFVRKALDCLFTPYELFWLDHLLPEYRREEKKEDTLEDDDSMSEPEIQLSDDTQL